MSEKNDEPTPYDYGYEVGRVGKTARNPYSIYQWKARQEWKLGYNHGWQEYLESLF